MCFLFHKNLRCDHNIKVHLLQEKCSKIEEETMFEQICFIKNISDLFCLMNEQIEIISPSILVTRLDFIKS